MSSSLPHYDSISNARDEPRKIFHCRAALSINSSPPIPAKTVDISASGCSAIIDRQLPEGEHCTIAINVILDETPMWITFDCRAQYSVLVGTTGFRVGLQFTQLDANASARLKQILTPS